MAITPVRGNCPVQMLKFFSSTATTMAFTAIITHNRKTKTTATMTTTISTVSSLMLLVLVPLHSKLTQTVLKGYLRYKTIFCHKVALDV